MFRLGVWSSLGARNFSSAVSGYCQVFMVTRARLRRSWLRPTAEDVSAFGQHRKFPLLARKYVVKPRYCSTSLLCNYFTNHFT